MKNNSFSAILMIISILLQCFCMNTIGFLHYELPFLSSLRNADSMSGNLILTLYSIMPFPFLLMFFSGEIKKITEGYGKLMIVRCYSKKRLIFNLLRKTTITISIITIFMWVIFTLLQSKECENIEKGKALTMYALTLTAIVFAQYILELYLEVQYANIATIIGMASMVLISEAIGAKNWYVNLIFFPNLSFAQKNGVISGDDGGISFAISCGWIIFLCIVMHAFILKKLLKEDIM